MIKDRNIAPGAAIQVSKIQGMGGAEPFTGEVHYVAKSGLQARTWLDGKVPKANLHLTITAAHNACVSNRGDVIYVCPGHTETISAAGGITISKSNVSIIGLGNGNYRPVISWSATASTWAVSGSNVLIKNIQTTNTKDEVVSMFNITGAGVTLDAVDFYPTTGQVIQFLLTTNAADQLTIQNCFHRQATAANANQVWIQLVGTDHTRILNNTILITAKAATASICISGSTAVVDAVIAYNTINWLGATITKIIECVTTSTGTIHHNCCMGGAAVLLAAAITGDAMSMFENYVTNTAGTASGALAPAVDTVT